MSHNEKCDKMSQWKIYLREKRDVKKMHSFLWYVNERWRNIILDILIIQNGKSVNISSARAGQ